MKQKKVELRDIQCLGFIILLPLSWVSISIGSVYRMTSVVLLLLFLVCTGGKIVLKRDKLKLFSVVALYFGYCMLTALWSTEKSSAITNVFGVGLLLAIAFVYMALDNKNMKVELINRCWILVGAFCAALFLLGGQRSVSGTERMSLVILGTKTDANEFASLLAITVGITTSYMLTHKGLHIKDVSVKIICVALCLLEIYVILMTGSRGALISCVVAFAVSMLSSGRLSIKGFLTLLVLSTLVLVVVLFWILPNISGEVVNRLSLKAIVADGGTGRKLIWENCWKAVISDPIRFLFGAGAEGVLVSNGYNLTTYMHNQLLQNLADYGLVGTVLYIVLLIACGKRITNNNPTLIGAFWGIMVNSMTITMGVIYKPLWIFLLMAFAGKQQDNEERISPKSLVHEKPQ